MTESKQPIGRVAYSGFAERYAAAVITKPHNALYERPTTMSLLGDVNGLHVLDAGCGPGICSEHLARNGATVHAFDITPEMVELARHRCAQLPVELMTGDLTAPLDWLPEQSFDKILCSLALDYVEELVPVFSEFRRVARRGAILVFSMAHPMRDWMVSAPVAKGHTSRPRASGCIGQALASRNLTCRLTVGLLPTF
ncbi:hypothetical protein BCAR13_2150002 [Paraburkholderia caribensis]|nr:hypothetical protein BCAR13_2150002 [Paraburkholderia caribensis]